MGIYAQHPDVILSESSKASSNCVNALSRANLISTGRRVHRVEYQPECVNALSRANLISTWKRCYLLMHTQLCQCPKSGKPHFYAASASQTHEEVFWCQCPKSGKPHFYLCMGIVTMNWGRCVNALSRANLISTIKENIDYITYVSVNALSRANLISTLKAIWKHVDRIDVSMP